MAFTAGEVTNIGNAQLDWYMDKGDVFRQSLQKRPLFDKMRSGKKFFSGGKGQLSVAISGAIGNAGVNDTLKGYTHNDPVVFYTPANIKRANYAWREHHIGLELTHTELKIDGISVVDPGSNGERTTEHSKRELHTLVGLFEDKLFDLGEQYARQFNLLLYGDGVADAKALHGLKLIVADDPSVGLVGGVNRATAGFEWWRNRARTAAFGTKVSGTPALGVHGGGAVTSAVADGGALLQVLQYELRQLTRYGGKPSLFVVGSDFLGAMEKEMRANGIYSQTGFTKNQDGSMGEMYFSGSPVIYDPTLDDLALTKRGYWIDTSKIMLQVMEDEWEHKHTPARPYDKFLMYRSITSTCQLVAKQCNSSLVIDIV